MVILHIFWGILYWPLSTFKCLSLFWMCLLQDILSWLLTMMFWYWIVTYMIVYCIIHILLSHFENVCYIKCQAIFLQRNLGFECCEESKGSQLLMSWNYIDPLSVSSGSSGSIRSCQTLYGRFIDKLHAENAFLSIFQSELQEQTMDQAIIWCKSAQLWEDRNWHTPAGDLLQNCQEHHHLVMQKVFLLLVFAAAQLANSVLVFTCSISFLFPWKLQA